jgi:hypothetical protein
MTTITTILFFILLSIGLSSFFYKIYLQVIINDPSKKGYYSSAVLRFVYITDFLPLSVKYKSPEETKLRKKANRALTIFYLCIILILVLSLIT